jgi:hypothetical protein
MHDDGLPARLTVLLCGTTSEGMAANTGVPVHPNGTVELPGMDGSLSCRQWVLPLTHGCR